MRSIVFIFILFPLLTYSQYRRYMWGPSEYFNAVVDVQTHQGYTINAVGTLVNNVANAYWCNSGPHASMIADGSGNLWAMGLNANGELGTGTVGGSTTTFAQITTDSSGASFTNVTQVYGGLASSGAGSGWAFIALKGDGTVWAWGALFGGMSGNALEGNRSRPVKVVIPGNVIMKKLQFCVCIFSLDVNGNVWSWGGNDGEFQIGYLLSQGTTTPNYNTPTQCTGLKSPIRDIAAGKYWVYAITVTGDSIYGNGKYSGPLGIGGAHQLNTPSIDTYWATPQFIWIDSYLNLPAKPKNLYANTLTSYAILKDGTAWAWGDNSQGGCGQGNELNMATYTTPWQGPFDVGDTTLQIPRPVQIYPGKSNWDTMFVCSIWTFSVHAEDSLGNTFFWGRNKGGIAGNEIQACDYELGGQGGNWPSSWDIAWPQLLDSVFIGTITRTLSQGCFSNPTLNNCNIANCSTTGNQKPVPSININWTLSQVTWDATASTDDHHISSYRVDVVSGPTTAVGCRACKVNTFKSNAVGAYQIKLVTVDNMWASDSTTLSFIVGGRRHGINHFKRNGP